MTRKELFFRYFGRTPLLGYNYYCKLGHTIVHGKKKFKKSFRTFLVRKATWLLLLLRSLLYPRARSSSSSQKDHPRGTIPLPDGGCWGRGRCNDTTTVRRRSFFFLTSSSSFVVICRHLSKGENRLWCSFLLFLKRAHHF